MRKRLRLLDPNRLPSSACDGSTCRSTFSGSSKWRGGGGGGLAWEGDETYVAPKSYQAALLAAGGVVTAVEAVLRGDYHNAFALVRPPGHHASGDHGEGFCLFNNIAIAAGLRATT